MQIVIYKAQGKDWQMARAGDSKCPFYTTSQFKSAARFADGRSASGWQRRCQRHARTVLGWKDAIFKRISEYEFEDTYFRGESSTELELLKRVMQGWDESVRRWRMSPDHPSIPTAFAPLAVVMDDVQTSLSSIVAVDKEGK